MLVCHIYASKALVDFDKASLDALAKGAAKFNKTQKISGYLYFNDGKFFQYLEGPEDVVDALFQKICKDKRHEVYFELKTELPPGAESRFPSWSMHSIEPKDLPGLELNLESALFDHVEHKIDMSELAGQDYTAWDEHIWRTIDKISAEKKGS